MRCQQMDWLKGLRSPIDLKDNVVLYKTCIKPIWMFGMELWDTVSASNISKLQRGQSNSLRFISDASWQTSTRTLSELCTNPTQRK